MLHSRHINEGLKCRTGLANCHAGAIKTVLAAAADHGEDMARFRVNRDNGSLRLSKSLVIRMCFREMSHSLNGCMLLIRIKCRVNLQSVFVKCVITVLLCDFLSNIVDEVCRFIRCIACRFLLNIQTCFFSFFRLGRCNVSVFFHLAYYYVFAGGSFIYAGGIVVGALR